MYTRIYARLDIYNDNAYIKYKVKGVMNKKGPREYPVPLRRRYVLAPKLAALLILSSLKI